MVVTPLARFRRLATDIHQLGPRHHLGTDHVMHLIGLLPFVHALMHIQRLTDHGNKVSDGLQR